MPTGTIADWPNATAPSGWLICDGGTYSRATYPALWAVLDPSGGGIGGVGDGSTTFTVPDFQGRISIGKAASGGAGTLGAALGSLDHIHAADPPDTQSVTANPSFDQEVDNFPLSGGAFCPNSNHTHFTNIGSFNTDTNNPPCRVIHKIIKT